MSRSGMDDTATPSLPVTDRFGPEVRLATALLALFGGLSLLVRGWTVPALPLLLLAAVLLWHYLRNNGVWLAFREFKRGNLGQVRRLLDGVRWPKLLGRQSLAYYHWLRGVVDTADGRYQAARVHLLVAVAGRLRTENDRALVHCLLSEIALQCGDHADARQQLNLARGLHHSPAVGRVLAGMESRLETPSPSG
jgi:hypothetical protein